MELVNQRKLLAAALQEDNDICLSRMLLSTKMLLYYSKNKTRIDLYCDKEIVLSFKRVQEMLSTASTADLCAAMEAAKESITKELLA